MKKYLLIAIFFCSIFAFASSQASWWNKFSPSKNSPNLANNQKKDNAYPSLTTDQVQDIKKLIPNYLIANPEILVKISKALQQKAALEEQNQAKKAIQSNAQALFHNPNSPTAGNVQGSVTLVEFFDYQCGHCKTAAKIVKQLIQNNPKLKVIYKEMPIFGDSSALASKAALAAFKQGKYSAYHDALFNSTSGINQDTIDAINKTLSIDTSPINSTQYTQIDAELSQNQQLAQALKLRGTPAFIITNKDNSKSIFIPGAVPIETLQDAINKLAPTKAKPSVPATTPIKPLAAASTSTIIPGAQTNTANAQTSTQTSNQAAATNPADNNATSNDANTTKPTDNSGNNTTSNNTNTAKPAANNSDATKPANNSGNNTTSNNTNTAKPAANNSDATKPATDNTDSSKLKTTQQN